MNDEYEKIVQSILKEIASSPQNDEQTLAFLKNLIRYIYAAIVEIEKNAI